PGDSGAGAPRNPGPGCWKGVERSAGRPSTERASAGASGQPRRAAQRARPGRRRHPHVRRRPAGGGWSAVIFRRAWWWALDYAYAAYWQVRAVGGRTPGRELLGGDRRPVLVLPGVYETWQFLRPMVDALSAAG